MAAVKFNTHIGQMFGRLEVISDAKKQKRIRVVTCRCQCGVVKDFQIPKLFSGETKSCGCFRDQVFVKHGHTSRKNKFLSSEYIIWNSMWQRVSNPKDESYENYGGRGIHICDRWREFAFFLEDMGSRPSKDHSIDRVNNDLGYSPENCRWATRSEQSRNTRKTRMLTADGRTMCMSDWARELGCSPVTISARIKSGWDLQKALTTPVCKR